MALLVALTVGCGRKNNAKTTVENATEVHDHSAHNHDHDHSGHSHDDHTAHNEDCGHDHSADKLTGHVHGEDCDHDHDDSAGGEHVHGEDCDHDHSGDNHDAHAGHDHSGHSHDAHAGHDHGSEAENPDEIVFPAEQAARTEFEVQVARRGDFREVIKCGGEITAAQSGVSVVTAPISGVITLVDGRIMASSPVSKGQAVFRISSGSLASGDAVLKAKIAYEQAKADFDRAERLYKDKMISQTDYLTARGAYLAAQSEYEPIRNTNTDGSISITAPAGGYLSQVSVSAGDYVEMGQPLATVALTGRMQLKALVSQRYFDRLGEIRDANFKMPTSGKYSTVSSLNGSLYTAGRIVSQGSSLIPIVFEFDGNGAIPDGAYVDVALLGRERHDVMTLPISAVTEQQGLYYVYVQLDSEHYSRREVRLGADDGKRVEILSGVTPGDRIVTKGAINVKMAAASGSIPHGHTH